MENPSNVSLSIDVIGICENCLFSFFGAIMSNHKKRFASHYESVIMPGLGCETRLKVRRCVSLFARVWCIDVWMAISVFLQRIVPIMRVEISAIKTIF